MVICSNTDRVLSDISQIPTLKIFSSVSSGQSSQSLLKPESLGGEKWGQSSGHSWSEEDSCQDPSGGRHHRELRHEVHHPDLAPQHGPAGQEGDDAGGAVPQRGEGEVPAVRGPAEEDSVCADRQSTSHGPRPDEEVSVGTWPQHSARNGEKPAQTPDQAPGLQGELLLLRPVQPGVSGEQHERR